MVYPINNKKTHLQINQSTDRVREKRQPAICLRFKLIFPQLKQSVIGLFKTVVIARESSSYTKRHEQIALCVSLTVLPLLLLLQQTCSNQHLIVRLITGNNYTICNIYYKKK